MTMFIGPTENPDKYELLEVHSRGGEGELWRSEMAVDSVRVPIALKIIHPDNADDIDTWHQRWLRQAELLKSIRHPGVVSVREVFLGPLSHERGEADTETHTLCLAMNWVEGESLGEWVSRRPQRDALESIRLIGGLAAAVDYLHHGVEVGQPLIHRDIKPANVLITDKGPVLVDFGFVRTRDTESAMTMVGSPAYMAPEAAAGLGYSEASDRYSLGATAFFALTGKPPTLDDPDGMRQGLDQVKGFEERPDLHEHLLAMLSRDPAQRPTSAVDWAQGLAALSVVGGGTLITSKSTPPPEETTPPPVEASKPLRRAGALVGAMVLLLLLGGGAIGWALWGGGNEDPPTALSSTETTDPTSTTSESPTSLMPGLIGMSREDALALLEESGVTDVVVEERVDPAEPDTVIEQSIEEGSEVTPEADVTLVVALSNTVDMPSLIGSTREDAEISLADFTTVDYVEQDSALTPGTVLEQTPDAEQEVTLDDPILVVVARETETPDFSTMTTEEATAFVEQHGGELETVSEYRPDANTGDYISQSPEAGQPLTETVTLTVAEGPGLILLEDIESLRMDTTTGRMEIGFGQGDVDGERHIHSLIFEGRNYFSSLAAGIAEYNLGRDFDLLRSVVGYDDSALAGGSIRLEIYGDGSLLFSNDYELGVSESISVDLSGVLRLEIRATTLCCTDGDLNERLVLGQIELLGPPSVIEEYRNTEDG